MKNRGHNLKESGEESMGGCGKRKGTSLSQNVCFTGSKWYRLSISIPASRAEVPAILLLWLGWLSSCVLLWTNLAGGNTKFWVAYIGDLCFTLTDRQCGRDWIFQQKWELQLEKGKWMWGGIGGTFPQSKSRSKAVFLLAHPLWVASG